MYDRVIVYLIREFSTSVEDYLSGQEPVSTTRHAEIQAAIMPQLRAIIGLVGTSDPQEILSACGAFIDAFGPAHTPVRMANNA